MTNQEFKLKIEKLVEDYLNFEENQGEVADLDSAIWYVDNNFNRNWSNTVEITSLATRCGYRDLNDFIESTTTLVYREFLGGDFDSADVKIKASLMELPELGKNHQIHLLVNEQENYQEIKDIFVDKDEALETLDCWWAKDFSVVSIQRDDLETYKDSDCDDLLDILNPKIESAPPLTAKTVMGSAPDNTEPSSEMEM